jgi:hypothetical protein
MKCRMRNDWVTEVRKEGPKEKQRWAECPANESIFLVYTAISEHTGQPSLPFSLLGMLFMYDKKLSK